MNHQGTIGWVVMASSLALGGCGSFLDDLDLGEFTPAPGFSQFDLSRLQPAQPATYVELREGLGLTVTVLAAHGDKCAEASDRTACETAFDALTTTQGFGHCVDHDCVKYYVVNRGEDSYTVGTLPELQDFFGVIDAPEEALSIASAHGYSWSASRIEEGAYRAVPEGYELIVTQMTSSCDPIERSRYLLLVTSSGDVTVKESEEIESSDGCV
jgi:hypothetical protein